MADGQILVELQGIEKRFGTQEVLRGIDLTLCAGTITGLLGPSGCGKTTLVNLIVGLSRASVGSVEVLGTRPPFAKVRHQLGFMPQQEALYDDLTATQNLRFFGSIFGMRASALTAAIPHVLQTVRLEDTGRKLVERFSGGMKRRLSLAVALLHAPRLLVLDEPTVGLDPEHRLELWRGFRELARMGSGLLITTHVMDEAASCDRIIMLRDGKILAEGSPAELIMRSGSTTLEQAFLSFETSKDLKEGEVHA
ncbi:MAG: ABC transporter ATP-binding protein [Coriobacteriales bacterium]|jgi:ABC-2 type transport system ATP-binding protein|nr:ABC transporter ATP-binding protein [Coriobacteriales bacterium]